MKLKELNFSPRYLERLALGKKCTTIRRRCDFKVGEKILIKIGKHIIGKAKIVRVERKKVMELTREDAKMDGFKSRKELLRALKRHYPDISEKEEICIIEWEWV